MNQFYKNHKKEIFLFSLMLTLELAMIFALIRQNNIDIFFRSDGTEYQRLVSNFINGDGFSLDARAPFIPTNYRTPIYPFWLAFIYLIFHSFKPAIFLGAITFALSAPMAYFIGRQIFSERIAFTSAIIFAVEPWALFQSGFMAAEQIFIPVFLLSVYLFCRYVNNGNEKYLYWSSVVLALSALIRPIAILFVGILIAAMFILEVKKSLRQFIKNSVLTAAIFLAVLSPWLIRNKIVLNTWQFSSMSNGVIYIDSYGLGKYLGEITNEHEWEKAAGILGTRNYEIMKRVNTSDVLADYGINKIKNNFGSFALMHLKAMPLFFLKNSYGNIFLDLKADDSKIQSQISGNIFKGNFNGALALLKNAGFSTLILIVLAFFWPIVIILTIMGVIFRLKQNVKDPFIWFLILWMLYFSFLAGNLLDISRYKLAVNMPLFALAIFGFLEARQYFKYARNF